MSNKSRNELLEQILVATNGGGGGGGGTALSFLSDGLYSAASPAVPPVGGSFFAVVDTTSNLSTLHGTSYTTGDGITGLTEGAYCEIETSCVIDNITSMVTMYFELITAENILNARDVKYEREQTVLNKLDANSPGLVKFRFLVTAEMATNGVRVVIGGHRGSAGTKVHSFKHTIKEYN